MKNFSDRYTAEEKKKIVTWLMMAFIIAMFVLGLQIGMYNQHKAENNSLEWYGEHCRCYDYIVDDEPLYALNISFTQH